MAPMRLELLDPATRTPEIQAIWTRLSCAPETGYFLSWGWMEHWLASLPSEARVRLAVLSDGGAPRAAFFIGEATTRRHGFLKSRGLFLNTTGLSPYDELCLEHNGILSEGPLPCSLRELLDRLPDGWEEFVMPAMSASRLPPHWQNGSAAPYTVLIRHEAPSPCVDLDAVRQRGDYPALLGAATRANIRRSSRLLASRGPVRCEVAGTVDRALDLFGELVALHQRAWSGRGQRGAFASDYLRAFHTGLIRRRFAAGEIQLVRVTAGETTVGCLYNFVFHGTVSFYQSGINYALDRRASPGLVCIAEAIRHNAEAGQRVFDFLGGAATMYKANLSTHADQLVWVTVQQPRAKFWLERTLRAAKRAVRRS